MANPTGAAKETMGFLADEFPALSNSARTFVRDHPGSTVWRWPPR